MIRILYDQNVASKLSQKENQSFRENIENHFLDTKEKYFLTPFSLLEYAGVEKKRIFNIRYKGKKWEEYLFKSYEEFCNEDIIQYIEHYFNEKIPKYCLKIKLKNKRKSPYLSEFGKCLTDYYINNLDKLFYNRINLYFRFDRWAVINISECSRQDKWRFIRFWTTLFMFQSCDNQFGSFRIVHRLCDELTKEPVSEKLKTNTEFMNVIKELRKLIPKCRLKSYGDLLDCEIIYHAFFCERKLH